MRLVRLRGESGPVRVEYIAPPTPEVETPDGPFIALPTEEIVQAVKDGQAKATPVTTLTLEGGFNIYLVRAAHDWTAAERYIEAFTMFLMDDEYSSDQFLGVPLSEHPDLSTWIPRYTLERMQGVHDQVTVSPLATRKVGRQGGDIVVVPGTAIPFHGQKRN